MGVFSPSHQLSKRTWFTAPFLFSLQKNPQRFEGKRTNPFNILPSQCIASKCNSLGRKEREKVLTKEQIDTPLKTVFARESTGDKTTALHVAVGIVSILVSQLNIYSSPALAFSSLFCSPCIVYGCDRPSDLPSSLKTSFGSHSSRECTMWGKETEPRSPFITIYVSSLTDSERPDLCCVLS